MLWHAVLEWLTTLDSTVEIDKPQNRRWYSRVLLRNTRDIEWKSVGLRILLVHV